MPKTPFVGVAFLCLCVLGCGNSTDEKQYQDFLTAGRDYYSQMRKNLTNEGPYENLGPERLQDVINRGQPNAKILAAQRLILKPLPILKKEMALWGFLDQTKSIVTSAELDKSRSFAFDLLLKHLEEFNNNLNAYSARKCDEIREIQFDKKEMDFIDGKQ